MKIETKGLLTISNFAKHADVSREAVYKAMREGRIESVTIGGVVFINKAESKKIGK